MTVKIGEKEILNSTLQSPVAVRDESIVEGSKSLGAALARTAYPAIESKKIGSNQLKLVPFSALQVIRKTAPANNVAPPAYAYVEIDELGFVQKVRNLDGTAVAPEVAAALRKWEFAPYKQNDQAIAVLTAIKSSDW